MLSHDRRFCPPRRVRTGAVASGTVTLSNVGGVPLGISALALTSDAPYDSDVGAFSIATPDDVDAPKGLIHVIPPGGTLDVEIDSTPLYADNEDALFIGTAGDDRTDLEPPDHAWADNEHSGSLVYLHATADGLPDGPVIQIIGGVREGVTAFEPGDAISLEVRSFPPDTYTATWHADDGSTGAGSVFTWNTPDTLALGSVGAGAVVTDAMQESAFAFVKLHVAAPGTLDAELTW
jgi:hypothetical protein